MFLCLGEIIMIKIYISSIDLVTHSRADNEVVSIYGSVSKEIYSRADDFDALTIRYLTCIA